MRHVLQVLAVVAAALSIARGTAVAQGTPNPHGRLVTPCEVCHVASGWSPVSPGPAFEHARATFPLSGAHVTTNCRACHASLDFGGTGTACVGCHRDVHQGELGVDCTRCHSTRSFVDRVQMTRLHQGTRFPLAGAHAAADCEQCHRSRPQGSLQWVNTSSDCVACHASDYAAARAPDHQAAGFPRDCTQCHSSSLWTRARFDHQVVGFPLTGAHRALRCEGCHAGGTFGGVAADCASCHLAAYQSTQDPPHATAGFPTTCTSCHTTTSWAGAAFNHDATRFALTGAHRAATCAACHVNGRYAGLGTDCVTCHLGDYQATTNPPHQGAGFPTACVTCHTTTGWPGATFNHDGPYFPIYSGAHRGKWADCATCHTNPASYAVFTCLTCHEHDRTRMDDKHRERSGYAYDSQRCYGCHPQGRS